MPRQKVSYCECGTKWLIGIWLLPIVAYKRKKRKNVLRLKKLIWIPYIRAFFCKHELSFINKVIVCLLFKNIKVTPPTGCFTTAGGTVFFGNVNTTVRVRTCMRWDSWSTHCHDLLVCEGSRKLLLNSLWKSS